MDLDNSEEIKVLMQWQMGGFDVCERLHDPGPNLRAPGYGCYRSSGFDAIQRYPASPHSD